MLISARHDHVRVLDIACAYQQVTITILLQQIYLKGLSHENLICFYWCRWIDKNVLHLFYFIYF
jgi:hypothetical protein